MDLKFSFWDARVFLVFGIWVSGAMVWAWDEETPSHLGQARRGPLVVGFLVATLG